MRNLRRLGNSISVSFPPDEHGFLGRECPVEECEGYFKISPGTGLTGENLPCHCPYCGHTASPKEFFTKAQIEYAKSVAIRQITNAVRADLKKMEFNHKPKGAFGIGISMKLKPGRLPPIRYYREETLETEAVCSECTLRYAVYGVFGFCPDCRKHNSFQILEKNLEVVGKMLELADSTTSEVTIRLIENALEDCVSAFDGFGREICRVYASKAKSPSKAAKVSFQNLAGAQQNVLTEFGYDISRALSASEWDAAVQAFQKRHVVAHKMGVIDSDYISKSGDNYAVLGRKVEIAEVDVRAAMAVVRRLGENLKTWLESL